MENENGDSITVAISGVEAKSSHRTPEPVF